MASPESFADLAEALALAGNAFRSYLRQRFKECHLDLTAEMVQVLHYLWSHHCVNQQQIANAVNRDKASLTAMLDNLVRRELVERQEDRQDRRNKRIVLTAKGQALEQQVMPLVQEMYAVAGQTLPEQQLHAGLAMLAQITQNLTQARK